MICPINTPDNGKNDPDALLFNCACRFDVHVLRYPNTVGVSKLVPIYNPEPLIKAIATLFTWNTCEADVGTLCINWSEFKPIPYQSILLYHIDKRHPVCVLLNTIPVQKFSKPAILSPFLFKNLDTSNDVKYFCE